MGTTMRSIGGNPAGFIGRIAGRVMNLLHGASYKKIIGSVFDFETGTALSFLDIGCGGGRAIACLHARFGASLVDGIDHSPEMARLSARVNARAVRDGRVRITRGSASALPYADAAFDAVTAFDTINFWDDMDASLAEVRRVLKPGGMFLVVNGYPKQGTKWWEFARFKSESAYREALESRGFSGVRTRVERGSIVIIAYREPPAQCAVHGGP